MSGGVQFAWLALSGVTWFLLHAGVAGSGLRRWLIARFGEKAYRAGFSLASLASLVWLIHEYGRAPYASLWVTPHALYFVPLLLMPLGFVLLAGAFLVPNPTAVGGEKFLDSPGGTRGLLRVTRHPFLWSAVLWSLAHGLVNPDAGSWWFFGSLGATAFRGTLDIDRKRRRTHPEAFARFEAETSNLPFAAVLAGRNRLVARELWLPVTLGLALTLAALALHGRFLGASALPFQAHGTTSDERSASAVLEETRIVAALSGFGANPSNGYLPHKAEPDTSAASRCHIWSG